MTAGIPQQRFELRYPNDEVVNTFEFEAGLVKIDPRSLSHGELCYVISEELKYLTQVSGKYDRTGVSNYHISFNIVPGTTHVTIEGNSFNAHIYNVYIMSGKAHVDPNIYDINETHMIECGAKYSTQIPTLHLITNKVIVSAIAPGSIIMMDDWTYSIYMENVMNYDNDRVIFTGNGDMSGPYELNDIVTTIKLGILGG
jgi:hypothetical protein